MGFLRIGEMSVYPRSMRKEAIERHRKRYRGAVLRQEIDNNKKLK
jgi:hypothetical protein